MGRNPTGLTEKHWKALELLSEGNKSIKAIAEELGWSSQYLYDLVEGNEEKTSKAAALFQAELRKVDAKISKKIKSLLKGNKLLAMKLINDVLFSLGKKKKLDVSEMRALSNLTHCLSKETPNVEIGSLTYSYTKGLSAEDLIHEFNRLKTIATGSSNRGAVQESFEGRQGILHSTTEPGSGVEEQSEDYELPPDAEAGDIS